MAKCKCRICGTPHNTEDAYRVVVNNKNQYYCSQEEYEKELERKKKVAENKDRVYRLICDIMEERDIINTALYKEWQVWNKVADNEKIAKYLEENKEYLTSVMTRLGSSEYARIRYLSAIIRDKIKGFVPKVEVVETPMVVEPSVAIDQTFEMYNGPTNISNRRRSFDEME